MANENISNTILRLGIVKNRLKELETVEKFLKAKIKDFLNNKNWKTVEHEGYQASLVSKSTITYNIDVMRENLGLEVFKFVTNKKHSVDSEKLQEFIKKYPKLKSELKKFIEVNYEVDEARLDEAINNQMVNLQNLKGCYTAIETSYINFKEL